MSGDLGGHSNSGWSFPDARPIHRPGRVRWKRDGTRWRTGGEVKGKLANGVGSQYCHTTSERGVSSITTADAHASAASSRPSWRPHWFKWTRLFRWRRNLVSERVPSRFKRSLPTHSSSVIPTSKTGPFFFFIHKLNLMWRWIHISKSTDNRISFNFRELFAIQSGQLTNNSSIAAKLPVP